MGRGKEREEEGKREEAAQEGETKLPRSLNKLVFIPLMQLILLENKFVEYPNNIEIERNQFLQFHIIEHYHLDGSLVTF